MSIIQERIVRIIKWVMPAEMVSFLKKIYGRYQRDPYHKPPVRIGIEITNKCNLRCTYCPRSIGINRKAGSVSIYDYERYLDALKKYKFDQIDFVGYGEGLLHNDWFILAKKTIATLRFKRIHFTTNGICLTEENISKLLQLPFDNVTISVNGADKHTYKKINNGDFFDRVIENIDRLVSVIKNGYPCKVKKILIQLLSGVQDEENIENFFKAKQHWFKEKIVDKYVVNLCDWGGYISAPQNYSETYYPCAHLYVPGITWNGDVYACCIALADGDNELLLGNLRDSLFKEIYESNKFQYLHQANISGQLNTKVSKCAKCNAWSRVGNYFFKNPLLKLKIGHMWI